jgi:hypothetical protein
MTIDEALLLIAVAKERGIKQYKINTDNGDRTKSVDLTHEGCRSPSFRSLEI